MRRKATLHLSLAVLMCAAGLGLLFVGFFVPPLGEIDSSVLVAYGEVSTFSGSLLGIDYRYRYRQGQHEKS